MNAQARAARNRLVERFECFARHGVPNLDQVLFVKVHRALGARRKPGQTHLHFALHGSHQIFNDIQVRAARRVRLDELGFDEGMVPEKLLCVSEAQKPTHTETR